MSDQEDNAPVAQEIEPEVANDAPEAEEVAEEVAEEAAEKPAEEAADEVAEEAAAPAEEAADEVAEEAAAPAEEDDEKAAAPAAEDEKKAISLLPPAFLGDAPVLLTGATGYIAGHICKQLLELGYNVRGTVRSLEKSRKDHLEVLAQSQPAKDAGGRLEFVEANLDSDDGWDDAMRGVRAVLHTASPFPIASPKDENELIRPAVDGTLRVLGAALRAGTVKRVVLTSSVASIKAGNNAKMAVGRGLDESDWADPDKCSAYAKSKVMAERAAWKFVREQAEGKMDLATINPSYVQGPLLTDKPASSHFVMKMLLCRDQPAVAKLPFNLVDVRDVAEAHIRALVVPEAAGKRFILACKALWLSEWARLVAAKFDPIGYNVPTKSLPWFVLRLMAVFDGTVKSQLEDFGIHYNMNNQQSQDVLGLKYRDVNDTIADMGVSLIDRGVVPDKRPAALKP